MNDFETWWYREGSAPPLPGEDGEEHCKRMCKIAWSNGAFKETEACAKLADAWSKREDDVGAFIGRAIRARNFS
jgi:hypothetical protein